ncbi:acyl-CoA dehydrogenase family protein [Streptomyces sp. VB1]|uniref:acyl-CoA dehydrogenase family protein n=1 Tax=Streptomyces sp. VB1 TaxID=2986803 RepID=UPI0022426003|nr:acyl-CoA dehydrogenase family protein [Streptomyces sp. VB1]UZI32369.1 acyl-CoA/acyl-ACP dehydrogenase [Streptomyces sp. VB1]
MCAATVAPEDAKSSPSERLASSVEAVAHVATQHARDVDVRARLPVEAIAALRERNLLAAVAPRDLGGAGLSVQELAAVARRIARSCGSTAMVWAMHQGQLACLCRHHGDAPALVEMARTAVAQQWLIASATSEPAGGGDIRTSAAALVTSSDSSGTATLTKDATTVSYGAAADLLQVTARRNAEAAANDQVLVAVLREQATLEQRGTWAPLGMRGTSSPGFRLTAAVPEGQVLSDPFADIAGATMVPLTHTLWAAVWLGLAGEAVSRAVKVSRRRAAGHRGGDTARSALGEARWRLASLEALLADMVVRTQELLDECAQPTAGQSVRTNALKVAASESALEIAHLSLRVCGMAGYSEEGPFSVARIIRDLSSAPIMINNNRLLDTTAQLMLMERQHSW